MFNILCLVILGVVPFQSREEYGYRYTPPKWETAKWTIADDKELVSIRRTVDRLWRSGPDNTEIIRNLYKTKVGPIAQVSRLARPEYQRARFWFLTLNAYFPENEASFEWSKPLGGRPYLEEWDVPPSYEFTRVAFMVHRSSAGYRKPNIELFRRLLVRDQDDLILKYYGIRIDNSKSFEFAEELYDKLPLKRRFGRAQLALAAMNEFGKRQDARFLRVAHQMALEVLSSKDPFYVGKLEPWRIFKKECEAKAKKFNIKLGSQS